MLLKAYEWVSLFEWFLRIVTWSLVHVGVLHLLIFHSWKILSLHEKDALVGSRVSCLVATGGVWIKLPINQINNLKGNFSEHRLIRGLDSARGLGQSFFYSPYFLYSFSFIKCDHQLFSFRCFWPTSTQLPGFWESSLRISGSLPYLKSGWFFSILLLNNIILMILFIKPVALYNY